MSSEETRTAYKHKKNDEKGFLSGNFELAVMANAGYTGGEGWLHKNECVPLSEGCSEGYTGG